MGRWFALLAAASLGLLAGCGHRESAVQVGDREQILHVGVMDEPNDLDPAYPDSLETEQVILSLMEGLAQYDPRTCLPVPAVAESWTEGPDHLTWTFHLRPEARWSNGDPVTAGDFVYAYRRMLSPRLAAEYAYMLFCLRNGEAYYNGQVKDFGQVGIEARGPHELVFHLAHPVPYLPKLVCHTAWYPIHPATIEKFGRMDDRDTLWTRPGNYVGNGPFTLAEWRPNQFIRVVKSPTYWGAAQVRLHEVYFYPVEDNHAEEAMFRDGQLHITATIPTDRIDAYRNDPRLRPLLDTNATFETYFYRFNTTHPPLDDVRVRRALAYVIDRPRLVDDVTRGGQSPAYHLTPRTTDGFEPTARMPYDPARARALLAAAGYPGGRGFPVLDVLYNTNIGHKAIAEAFQQMWRRELGIDVRLVSQEGKIWVENTRTLRYDISRGGWIGDYLDPSSFLDTMTSDSGQNQTGWKNAEYDRLIARARETASDTERYALFQRCEQILADQCPIVPIYFYARDNLRRPEVKGWYSNLLDQHPLANVWLEQPAAAQ